MLRQIIGMPGPDLRQITRQTARSAAGLLTIAILVAIMLPRMSVSTAHVQVARPMPEVWAVLDNPAHAPAWFSQLRSCHPSGTHRRLAEHWQVLLDDGREYRVEQTALRTAGELLLDATRSDGRQTVGIALLLTEIDGATQIDAVVRVQSMGFIERVRALFFPTADADLAAVLRSLANEVEALSPPSSTTR